MSINYTQTFTRLGKIVKAINALLTFAGTTVPGYFDAILDQYEDRRDLVPNLQNQGQERARSVEGWIGGLKSVADRTLGDLQSELNATSADPTTILPLLLLDMVANSKTVVKNVISTPAITAGGSNVGTGSMAASTMTIAGIADERGISETIEVACIADRFTGAASGAEVFSVVGLPAWPATSPNTRGSGNGPAIVVADANNLLLNGTFEAFTVANTPDSWTLGTGAVAGTTILQEASNLHRGSSALRFKGDGSTTSVTVSQTPAANVLRASTTYAVGVWLRKAGTVTGGSTFTVRVTGTGITTTNLFSADPTTLTTSYALKSAYFSTPANLPSDAKVEFVWTSANAAGSSAQVLADDFVLAVPTPFGSVSYAIFAGATPFVKGDLFSVVTASDYAGVWQTFFTRFYGTALPSATSGAETIADSLAT